MSILDVASDNFRFHDKTMRAIGYFLKSLSYKSNIKGTSAGTKMNKIGSKISWVRQSLRVGSDIAIYKKLIELFNRKKNASIDKHLWYTTVIENLVGVYFYIIDHWEWATTVGLLKVSKSTAEWIDTAGTKAWLFTTTAQTVHRFVEIYKVWKKLSKSNNENLGKEEKQELYSKLKTTIFMLFKGFVDYAMIAYYLKPEIAAGPILSYLFGVIASSMDIILMLKGGSF